MQKLYQKLRVCFRLITACSKVIAKSGWFAARPSGTEDVYKIYAESFRDEEHLKLIQHDAQVLIADLFNKA
jgi:phosphoglucomutase